MKNTVFRRSSFVLGVAGDAGQNGILLYTLQNVEPHPTFSLQA